jgi:hypothetical protein
MKAKIAQIKTLVSELEDEASRTEDAQAFRGLSGLELPDIICDIVDLLLPELKPYEASFYIYFIRHSIVSNGTPYIRVSRRSLQSGIVKSAYSGSTSGGKDADSSVMSYATVQQTMVALEAVGAIRQEGEPNRDGTLYRILLPEEIDICQQRKFAKAKIQNIAATENEADFYNIRQNRQKIFERDKYKCTYCGNQLTRFTATLDHITPIIEGGDNRAENLTTACLQCNSRKTSRPLGDFLAEKVSR